MYTKNMKDVKGMRIATKPMSMQVVISVVALLFLWLRQMSFFESEIIIPSYSTIETKHQVDSPRPIMYTFFELKKLKNGDLANREFEYHQNMLNTWAKLWSEAGWEPRVLTLEDAQKHPDYSKFSRKIMQLETYLFQESYNYMCFVRWLAMAAHGNGGWMTDYDTFPVGKLGINNLDGHQLPNYGVFTSFERWVPSLLSGSSSEWNRMAVLMMDMAIKKIQFERKSFYSDMLALMDIYVEDQSTYIQEFVVATYPYSDLNTVNCTQTKDLMSVHLSHASTRQAMEAGLLHIDEDENYEHVRYLFAEQLVANWREQCIPDDFQEIIL